MSLDEWMKGAISCGRERRRGAPNGVEGHQECGFGHKGWVCGEDVLVGRLR